MTTLTTALKDLIAGCAGITAIIGTNPMRLYPVRLPQPPIVYPAITYQYIDATGVYSHSGYSGVKDPRIQLTIWTQNYNDADNLVNAIRAITPTGLNGFKGTQSTVQIDRLFIVDGTANFDPATQIHMRTLDLMISYVG
jgi:hypothetical protein